jgi:hypothetical protein
MINFKSNEERIEEMERKSFRGTKFFEKLSQ